MSSSGARWSFFLVVLIAAGLAVAACSGGSGPCDSVDCGANGRCAVEAGRAACACDPGYTPDGLTCIVDPCAASPCVYGSCRPSGRNALCDCYPGYAGTRCDGCAPGYRLEGMTCVEGSACLDDPCVYGRCHAEGGLPVCDCFPGYAGDLCDDCAEGYHPYELACVSDSPCDPDPCVHGACSASGGGASCACDPGYAGETCDACAPGYHAEGLSCVPDVGGPCDPNPCQDANRHVCQPDGDAYTCACDPGYHDEAGACVPNEVDPCDPNPCQLVHRTVCTADGDGYTCACDAGFHDQAGACVADSACSPNPCVEAHRTICQLDGDGYACLCDPGWHDDAGACVEDSVCDPDTTCSGRGDCTGNGLECACDTGYDGDHCESCAAGYHLDAGACVPDSACQPNPCQQVNRTRCVEQAGSYVCLCDLGYQDMDGQCVGVCDTVVTYEPQAGQTITALYIRGEFNGFGLTDPFDQNPDGSWTVVLDLPAGDYAYKLYDSGTDAWFEDATNPYFKWYGTPLLRNSRLRVRDCDQPQLKLVAQPSSDEASGSISFQVEYVDGAQGDGADAAACTATRNDEALPGAFDPASGVFTVADTGLSDGKYAYRFRACDLGGRCAERLYVPVWLEQTPFAWPDAVLYFAMTDRFVDGDAANDAPVGGQVSYKADWQGGDFAGLLDEIESGYFDDLGVNAIWISSISQNTAGANTGTDDRWYSGYHSYWPISTGWREGHTLPGVQPVDPHFGDLAQFKHLVQVAHAHGIRVLIDFVANHVHSDSPVWTQHQDDDPPWFHLPVYVCGWDQPITCWFASYLPDFEYKTLDVMNTVVEHAIWLIEETDVDGFRLDAVKHMIDDFSYTLRGRIQQAITTTGLRFYMVGETFTGEGEGEASLIRHYVRPEMLDGQFDFPLFWATVATFLREERDFLSLEGVLEQFDGYYGGWAVMSNFLGNHDVARAISHANGDISDLWGNDAKEQGWNDPPSDPAGEEPYRRLRLAWTFLMTIRGIPLIYYGDEFGMAGAGDPDNRRMMKFAPQLSSYQQATEDHVAKLAAVRHAHRALRYGQRSQLFNDGLFWAYAMVEGSDRVVVVFNRNAGSQTRSVPVASTGLSDGTVLRDAIHDTTVTVSGGNISVSLGGRDSAVFVQD